MASYETLPGGADQGSLRSEGAHGLRDAGHRARTLRGKRGTFRSPSRLSRPGRAGRRRRQASAQAHRARPSVPEAQLGGRLRTVQADQTEGITNVEGLVDDILVVTDPEVTSEEYDEVIERAQEIVEDTPEGNVPFDEEYVGQYLLTCPICGTTFVSQQMLEPGATCPACMEVPESFVVKGKIDTDENVAIDNGLQVDEEQKEETEAVPDTTSVEEPVDEEVEDEDIERQTASKEIPEGNKLQETKLQEDTYEEGIFYEIEAALTEAGLNPVRFSESGVMTNNLGWTVTGEDGTKQQIIIIRL